MSTTSSGNIPELDDDKKRVRSTSHMKNIGGVGDVFRRATSGNIKSPRDGDPEKEITDINELRKYFTKKVKKIESERDEVQDRVTELEDQVMSLSNINVALQSQLMEVNEMMNRLRRERDEARKERDEALNNNNTNNSGSNTSGNSSGSSANLAASHKPKKEVND